MKRWVLPGLVAVLLFSILMHTFPLFENAVWGSDTGEYYYLTRELVKNDEFVRNYDGWGQAYPDFPGMFAISGFVYEISGVDLLSATLWTIPLIAALGVLPLFLLIRKISGSDLAGLAGAFFFAASMPHVFPASHAMPGSLADFLLIVCLLLLTLSTENKKFYIPLILASAALVTTHHLTSYFLLIMVLGSILLQAVRGAGFHFLKYRAAYAAGLLAIIDAYWFIYAPGFADAVISKIASPLVFIAAPIGALAVLLAIARFVGFRSGWAEVSPPSTKLQGAKYLALVCSASAFIGASTAFGVQGTNVDIPFFALLLVFPFILFIGFASVGVRYLKGGPDMLEVLGWALAILASTLLGIVLNSRELIAYRHGQYLMIPGAILAGVGAAMLFRYWHGKEGKYPASRKLAAACVCAVLLLVPLSAYPPKDVMGGFQEGTTDAELESILWMGASFDEGTGVAADHRTSSLLFGMGGLNPTWDYAQKTYHGETFDDARDEFFNSRAPSGVERIDAVLLTDEMKSGVTLLQWETAEPIPDAALEKFEREPFVCVFRNGEASVYALMNTTS